MPKISCPPGVWTAIPDGGVDLIIEARERGLFVDTTGGLTTAEAAQAHQLSNSESMVVQAGVLSNPVHVMPSNPVVPASVRYQPV